MVQNFISKAVNLASHKVKHNHEHGLMRMKEIYENMKRKKIKILEQEYLLIA